MFNIFRVCRKVLRSIYAYKVKRESFSYEKPIYVGSYSNVTNKTILGKNVNFNGMCIKGGGNVKIGDNFHSGKDCLIITSNHNFDNGNKIPYDDTYIDKDIIIENNVWLGDRVILLGGIIIGEGAVIQAGSVVVSDIERYAIAGGHPARVFSYRDIEHYNNLKKKALFH